MLREHVVGQPVLVVDAVLGVDAHEVVAHGVDDIEVDLLGRLRAVTDFQRMAAGMNVFAFLTIPFFIFTGELMMLTRRSGWLCSLA